MGLLVLLSLLSGGGWYVYTGHISPARTCKRCGGLGFRRFLASTYTECSRCGGYGRILRPAARIVRRRRTRAGKAVRARMVNAR
jgi:hypothetical protein